MVRSPLETQLKEADLDNEDFDLKASDREKMRRNSLLNSPYQHLEEPTLPPIVQHEGT
eukprot:jgi/Psemu1/41878/gm1.41878_g